MSERPIGRFNWPARKQCAYVSFAFGHGRFKRDQAIGKAGLELAAAETPLQQEGTAMILRSLVACLGLSATIVPSAVYAAVPAWMKANPGGYNQSGNSFQISASKTKLMSLNASKLASAY